ncbi:MAG: CDP-diacylglycerol--serine O-phosphatidyltransferase [Dehalococcoidia bacterium]
MTIRMAAPALVTLISLSCGLAAIEAAHAGQWDMAFRFIMAAAIADAMDGTLARLLHASSDMGKELDSLSDLVTFGAAPAFLLASRYSSAPTEVIFGAMVLFVAAGAYRLARYNGQSSRGDNFCGMPITAAGLLLAAAVAGPVALTHVEAVAVAIALSALMVSRAPFPMLKFGWGLLLPALGAAIIPVALANSVEWLAVVAILVLGIYVVMGVANALSDHVADAVPEEVREDAPAHT